MYMTFALNDFLCSYNIS